MKKRLNVIFPEKGQVNLDIRMENLLDKVSRNFSKLYPVIDDINRRQQKGLKAAAILKEVLGNRYVGHVLDVGCSNAGFLDVVIEELKAGFGLGIDLDGGALPKPSGNRIALVANALALPVSAESIDVVLCNHTYEHVSDAKELFREIRRVLKPGGVVYFAAMNSRWPFEPHYNLPFIHWLPTKWSTPIMHVFGHRLGYIERPLNTAGLRRLVAGFGICDYTLKVVGNPTYYRAEEMLDPRVAWFVYPLAKLFYGFLPIYLWVLIKTGGAKTVR